MHSVKCLVLVGTRTYRYRESTRCAGTAVVVEAEGFWEAEGWAEAEVLATTAEAPAETQGSLEEEEAAREHRAVWEPMAAAAVPGAVLVAVLVERPLPVGA